MTEVFCGDARDLAGIESGSVQCVMLSVPYWGLRKYLDDPQEIGREDTLQVWLDNLVDCAREWRRCLHPAGTLWVNCGDSYTSRGGDYCKGSQGKTSRAGAYQDTCPNDGRANRNAKAGIAPKNLLGLPWRLAFALQADGWYLRSCIVWAKGLDWTDAERQAQDQIRDALDIVREQATSSLFGLSKELDWTLIKANRAVNNLAMSGSVMPESVKDRPTSSYEMLFLLSKSEKYFYDRDAIKVPQSGTAHSRGSGITPKGDLATHGEVRANNSWHESVSNVIVPGGRNARNVWRIPTQGSPSGGYLLSDGRVINHFAAYPRALPARVIKTATSAAGRCTKCFAPWKRVTRPTPEYAKLLGKDWADYDQDAREGRGHSISPQRPTKRGETATASYETVAWVPTCRCFGKPVEAGVACNKCGGSKREISSNANCEDGYLPDSGQRASGKRGRVIGGAVAENSMIETGNPCPACICDDCNGTGKKHVYPRGNEATKAQVLPGRHPASIQTDHDGRDFAKLQPTDGPCPTCDGIGATGRTNGEIWSADVLEQWPREPCVVLDPMCGTGTTLLAALDLGRSPIGNDLNPDYVDLARERLEAWPSNISGAKKRKETSVTFN